MFTRITQGGAERLEKNAIFSDYSRKPIVRCAVTWLIV